MAHYLDNAATTQVLKCAADKAYFMMTGEFANPSAVHTAGRRAAAELASARAALAEALGCEKNEITFTSGATEATNTALLGAARKYGRKSRHIITGAAEHAATLNTAARLENEGFEVTYLKPGPSGSVSVQDVEHALREDTVLISLMMVNNETGAITPIGEITRMLRRHKHVAFFHTDVVQAFFKLPFSLHALGVDFASVSGHKFGAPKGVGALYIRDGLRIPPLLTGGGQERGMRSGTEALPLIAAMGEACRCRAENFERNEKSVQALYDYLLERLRCLPVRLNGGGVPGIVNLSIPGTKSEVMIRILESAEVYVSGGSACSRGKRSHVLTAMNIPAADIDGALRISFSPENTADDVDAFVEGIKAGMTRFGVKF